MSRTPGTCGACIAFLPEHNDHDRGRCRLRPEMGVYGHLMPRCPKYFERGTGATWTPPKVARPKGMGKPRDDDDTEVIIHKPKEYGATIDLGDDGAPMDTNALRALIRDVIRAEGLTGETPIGKKWEGGTVVMKPADASLQAKEIPVETFFHKVVMVRDRLRVLEQKINGHAGLSDSDKVEMQQYVTRCYGSLTTFNVLFRDKDDQFEGSSG